MVRLLEFCLVKNKIGIVKIIFDLTNYKLERVCEEGKYSPIEFLVKYYKNENEPMLRYLIS